MDIVQTEERAGAIHGVDGRFFAVTIGGSNYKPGTFTSQKWIGERRPISGYARGATLQPEIRFDDQCRNGHNSFAITAVVREPGARDWAACGCLHDDIARVFPELAPLIKWHLTSSDGPMHYIANTVYHASNRDHNGLLKDEKRQIKNGKSGLPAWKLAAIGTDGNEIEIHNLPKYIDSADQPECPYSLAYAPWCRVGEGKERDFAAARAAAVWPDATDEQLSLPRAELTALLESRHADLNAQFRAAIEGAGLLWAPESDQ